MLGRDHRPAPPGAIYSSDELEEAPSNEIRVFRGARARGGPAGDSAAYHDCINYVIEAEKLGFSSVVLVDVSGGAKIPH